MQWTETGKRPALPSGASKRLSFTRLRRPTPLPTLVPTTRFGRYLHRLAWLFGSARL